MNPYSIPPFVSAVAFGVLGVYVFLYKRNSSLNKSFAALCGLTFFWQFSWVVLFNVHHPDGARILVKVGWSGITFLPAVYYHFVLESMGVQSTYKRQLKWIYAIGFIFLGLLWSTKNFINGFNEFSWGLYPKAALPIHPLYLIYLGVVYLLGVQKLITFFRGGGVTPARRVQAKYILISLVMYGFAGSDFAINYGVPFYPLKL